jgi:hypothetical protein
VIVRTVTWDILPFDRQDRLRWWRLLQNLELDQVRVKLPLRTRTPKAASISEYRPIQSTENKDDSPGYMRRYVIGVYQLVGPSVRFENLRLKALGNHTIKGTAYVVREGPRRISMSQRGVCVWVDKQQKFKLRYTTTDETTLTFFWFEGQILRIALFTTKS